MIQVSLQTRHAVVACSVALTCCEDPVRLEQGTTQTIACSRDVDDDACGKGVESGTDPCNSTDAAARSRLAAGPAHACVAVLEGRVKCWGSNMYGGAGNLEWFDVGPPTDVPTLVDVVAIGLGSGHSCVSDSSGKSRCWGLNNRGQVGDLNATGGPSLNLVHVDTCVQTVAAGGFSTAAVDVDGRIWGWGEWNGRGSAPVRRFSIDVLQVSIGYGHGCALMRTGQVACWGPNKFGQIGDGSTTDRDDPVSVFELGNATWVSAGDEASCAVLSDGVWCWGRNENGKLGDGTSENRSTPVHVAGTEGAVAVALGFRHACALHQAGIVHCWGGNLMGQLGDGSREDHPYPVPVIGLDGVVEIAANAFYTCALRGTGEVFCWGDGETVQIEGVLKDSPVPVRIDLD